MKQERIQPALLALTKMFLAGFLVSLIIAIANGPLGFVSESFIRWLASVTGRGLLLFGSLQFFSMNLDRTESTLLLLTKVLLGSSLLLLIFTGANKELGFLNEEFTLGCIRLTGIGFIVTGSLQHLCFKYRTAIDSELKSSSA